MATKARKAAQSVLFLGMLTILSAPPAWSQEARSQDPPEELPKTIKNVVYADKVGAGRALFGGASVGGTLVVSAENLEFRDKGKTLVIPTAQMASVTRRRYGSVEWMIIEYQDGGATKTAAFQPSAHRGNPDFDGLERVLRYVFEHRAQTEEKAPVATPDPPDSSITQIHLTRCR